MRRVAALVYPGVEFLDAVGPLEVFAAAANELGRRSGLVKPPTYAVSILGAKPGPVRTSSGLQVVADGSLRDLDIDTLLVPGGDGVDGVGFQPKLVAWLRRVVPRVRRVGSVCTGAFLLAAAGLLEGRRAVTHWGWCERLATRYPRIRVDADALFTSDGNIWTSAGVTSGIDLALALVEEDLGRSVSLAVARTLVMFLKRPGGQSQFSMTLVGQLAEREPIRDAQQWIVENLAGDLSVGRIADRVHMSPRHFARVFAEHTRCPPAEYVERLRVDAARRLLQDTRMGTKEIAAQCGFGNADGMRRAFLRLLDISPHEYRDRFRSAR